MVNVKIVPIVILKKFFRVSKTLNIASLSFCKFLLNVLGKLLGTTRIFKKLAKNLPDLPRTNSILFGFFFSAALNYFRLNIHQKV